MNLHEQSGAIKTAGSSKVVFILDASESAESHQQEIIALAQQVLSGLPAKAERTLYFLGNPSAYPPNHFASRAGEWFRANRQRASLVTPI